MTVAVHIARFLAIGIAVPVLLHVGLHGFSGHQLAIASFLWLNVMICLWEICLLLRIDFIRSQYEGFLEDGYRGRELERVGELFTRRLGPGEATDPNTWAEIWSTYALYDESYADRKSYGFFIDVGNGLSMIVPSILCLYGMTFDLFSARVLGVLLIVCNYQMWYGTLVYFGSYLFNRRYAGHSLRDVALFVGVSNGMWFTLPLWAMWVGWQLVQTNTFDILR